MHIPVHTLIGQECVETARPGSIRKRIPSHRTGIGIDSDSDSDTDTDTDTDTEKIVVG